MNIAKPFAKASYRINKPEDIAIGLARAIRAAVSGRPGGVYLDLTTALLGATMDKSAADKTLFAVTDAAPRQIPAPDSIERAMKLLASAKKPLIIIGKGAAYAQADNSIKSFVEQTGIPFLPMSMAKGLLPDDHAQSAAAARSFVLKNADVVMLLGARLNWLLGHGKGMHWNPDVKFVQLDIDAKEFDSNKPIAAPVAGDIGSSIDAMLASLKTMPIAHQSAWMNDIQATRKVNAQKMADKLSLNPSPMSFFSALKAVKDVLEKNRDVYLVNEGANTLDDTRNVINMYSPRHRLDTGTWGVMGIGMGYAIGAAITTGKPVVAIEGDSAFGFSGMEIDTIARYKLPIIIVIFNNGGIYRGDHVNLGGGSDLSPTTLLASARYDKLMDAYGEKSYNVTTPAELEKALADALANLKPAIINCVIDTKVGTESGHIGSLNPKTTGK